MMWRCGLATIALAIVQTMPGPAASAPPLLAVLAPTGVVRDGLPVYTRHPNASAFEAVLGRGFPGRLVRLYRWEQQFLQRRDGTAIEPAYLLLSRNEGGFPRFGFWLDDARKDNVGYVDLHERMPATGRFGALDQIFPHELMHVIVQQLAPQPPAGTSGANQVHAIGVRTDRRTAFNEGFAEHAQVLAVDDPDAAPPTAALRTDAGGAAAAHDRLQRYRRALEARWSLAPPARLGFILWFSQTEQALRYHAVKANRFAREPDIRLPRASGDLYAEYLLENILPGPANGAVKPTSRLLATEGVVAAFFSRWVTTPALQRPADDAGLYARFEVSAADATPMDHAYLKLFSVFADRRPGDTDGVIRSYVDAFPGERDAVAELARAVGFAWPLPEAPELWLANNQFLTGTTLFDQYRSLPRAHTFDVNAASLVDLLTVPGLSVELASAIQRGAPYRTLADLERVPGFTPALGARFRAMEAGMAAIRDANAGTDIESINIGRLFRPVLLRVTVWMIVCAIAAGWLYGRVRRIRAWRLALNGFAAAFLGLVPPWFFGAALQVGNRAADPAVLTLLPIAALGVLAALWQLARHRSRRDAGRVLAAWMIAAIPALVITTPLA